MDITAPSQGRRCGIASRGREATDRHERSEYSRRAGIEKI